MGMTLTYICECLKYVSFCKCLPTGSLRGGKKVFPALQQFGGSTIAQKYICCMFDSTTDHLN